MSYYHSCRVPRCFEEFGNHWHGLGPELGLQAVGEIFFSGSIPLMLLELIGGIAVPRAARLRGVCDGK